MEPGGRNSGNQPQIALAKERRLPSSSLRAYFFVQSGHGHLSQPQPVHTWRIMAK